MSAFASVPLVRILHTGGMVVTGVPLAQGLLHPGEGLHCGVPLWWDERSLWPDGSVKWLMLHARTENAGVLELHRGGSLPGAADFDGVSLHTGGCQLAFSRNAWSWETPGGAWRLESDNTNMDGLRCGKVWTANLLEASSIAPLLMLRQDGDVTTEWLLRPDGASGSLYATRRVSACKEGSHHLISSEIRLSAAGSISFSQQCIDAQGLGDLASEQHGFGVRLLEAGARHPARIFSDGTAVSLHLWPEDAGAWPIAGGTSFRHELCFYSGGYQPLSTVSFEPGYLAGTGVLSACYVAGADQDRLLFPGFELGYRRLLDGGRLSSIGGDPACFGLFHYGDWPLNPGQYGAAGRCYADNEYDTAYAYYQGYAAFGDGEYLSIARRCAVHMADVDCNCLTGDMRYHGYSEEAEDHGAHRAPKGEMGHWWSDGLWLGWFLHGDPWCRRTALALTWHVCRQFPPGDGALRQAWAVCERNLGWPLVVAAAACESEPNPEAYSLATRICGYVARFARNPDAEYECADGDDGPFTWWRTAMKDGCKPFMLGVMLEGLERFHRLTGCQNAADAILSLARYLIEVAWNPWRMEFTYEINAYGRGHRNINAQQLTPLVVRGLAYAYGLSGDPSFRDVALRAFHACLWTLHGGGANGKDIALVCRSLGAFAAMAARWAEDDSKSVTAGFPCSGGRPLELGAVPEGKYELPGSYADEGAMALSAAFAKCSSDRLNLRALVHLDGGPGRCAVSVVTFYDYFCVRFFDRDGTLIESLDSTLSSCVAGGWQEGGEHLVEVLWRAPGRAEFLVDGRTVDSRAMPRPLSGSFTRLFVGEKPGGWAVKGAAMLKSLQLGPGVSGPAFDESAGE